MGGLKPGEPLEEFLASPLADGCYRTLRCTACGAVTYLRIGGTDIVTGDPGLHNRWHHRGLLARIREALGLAR